MRDWKFLIHVLVVVLFTGALAYDVTCTAGWFGSQCQYKCHCRNRICQSTGQCASNKGCRPPMFGPACQYYDGLSGVTDVPKWLSDGDDHTCNTGSQDVLNLTGELRFAWLRIVVKNPDLLGDIKVELQDQGRCKPMSTSIVDDRILDIYCNRYTTTSGLTLRGAGVMSLCSLYLSQGRNVALKQPTIQYSETDSHTPHTASANAVDGDSSVTSGKAWCAVTDAMDGTPTWSLVFNEFPMTVYQMFFYLGASYALFAHVEEVHTAPFVVSVVGLHGSLTLYYEQNITSPTDRVGPFSIQVVGTQPVKRVVIHDLIDQFRNKQVPFTLCEVEIFGDTMCPQGRYGRDCEFVCHCVGSACAPSTGGCPRHCSPRDKKVHSCELACQEGYHGFDCSHPCSPNCRVKRCDAVTGACKDCMDGFHGAYCNLTCPVNCLGLKCDVVSGKCLQCPNGLTGSYCTEACTRGYHGPSCRKRCNPNCLHQTCNRSNGKCSPCEFKFKGEYCNLTECPVGYFGFNCVTACPTNCLFNICDEDTGVCVECPKGFTGIDCTVGALTDSCPDGFYGNNCSTPCGPECLSNLCSSATGVCFQCPPGYNGGNCNATSRMVNAITSVTSGMSIMALLLIPAVATSVCCVMVITWGKSRRKKTSTGTGTVTDTITSTPTGDAYDTTSIPSTD